MMKYKSSSIPLYLQLLMMVLISLMPSLKPLSHLELMKKPSTLLLIPLMKSLLKKLLYLKNNPSKLKKLKKKRLLHTLLKKLRHTLKPSLRPSIPLDTLMMKSKNSSILLSQQLLMMALILLMPSLKLLSHLELMKKLLTLLLIPLMKYQLKKPLPSKKKNPSKLKKKKPPPTPLRKLRPTLKQS